MRKSKRVPNTERAVKLLQNRLEKLSSESGQMDNDLAIEILNQSTECGWTTVYPLKEAKKKNGIDWSRV